MVMMGIALADTVKSERARGGVCDRVADRGNDGADDKEFMTTLAKGLAVLGSFDKQRPAMTLSQAAEIAGLSRATARRILRTLAGLGYVVQNGRVLLEDSARNLLNNDMVRAAYLGL